jgi:hypothetical protein
MQMQITAVQLSRIEMKQFWHSPKKVRYQIKLTASHEQDQLLKPVTVQSFVSDFYGRKEENQAFYFVSRTKSIKTKIAIV